MKVGIIGASSQVGASVSYSLKKYHGIEVVCFIRSTYSSIFFDLLGIGYEYINLRDKVDVKNKLKDFNAILDFSYPTGQLFIIKKNVKEITENIISCMPEHSTFIYMSSIMAYGMPPEAKYIKDYVIPRSSYAYIKRHAEKAVTRFGYKYKVKAYNFRLGQVHGILQSVNSSFREKFSYNQVVYVDGSPEELTNTIFISAIADAIKDCIEDKYKPGTYTLVSTPQWTLKELYGYYSEYYNFSNDIVYVPTLNKKLKTSKKGLLRFVLKFRSILEIYILMKFPSLATKIKGRYRERKVVEYIAKKDFNYGDLDIDLLGKPSKKAIPVNNSTISKVKEKEREFDHFYNELIFKNRV